MAITQSPQLLRTPATLRMLYALLDMIKDALNKLRSGRWIIQRHLVRNGIQIGQSRLRPDYFSHRARRLRACPLVAVRPSATALSPRAMPSSIAIRCCIRS